MKKPQEITSVNESLRDNKDQYLQHLPRVKKLLHENLKKEKFEEFNSLLSPLLNYVRY